MKEDAGGLAVRDVADVILEEKRREDWFRGFHLGVSRLVWSDVWGAGREAAKARIRREVGQTQALWGTSVDDLARFRTRGVGRRPEAATPGVTVCSIRGNRLFDTPPDRSRVIQRVEQTGYPTEQTVTLKPARRAQHAATVDSGT